MEGSKHDDLRRQLDERETENRGLREQLERAESEIDRLRGENEQLRKELKAAGRGPKHGSNSRKRKTQRKRPGRKAGQGPFAFRQAPADTGTSSEQPIEETRRRSGTGVAVRRDKALLRSGRPQPIRGRVVNRQSTYP